jgi:putative chitinase
MKKEAFMSFYLGTPSEKAASDCYDAVDKALTEQGINSPLTLIGALATIRTEVGKGFKPIEEIASGSDYEGRADLGNQVPGFGRKYKGRGYIQLTGYYNYKNYGDKLGIDLVCHPELALTVDNSAKILAVYFKDRKVNMACDVKDWVKVRKLINGGTNGLEVFTNVINQYYSKYEQ